MDHRPSTIRANKTRFGDFIWEQFCKWGIHLRFHEFTYDEVEIDPNRSILMIANHISWWDGFWPIELNRIFLGKRYHVMMLESELSKRMFMTRGGAFSIDPQSRSIIETLAYTKELLSDPANMVMMYPQGRLHSIYQDEFSFEKGMDRLLGANRQVLLASAMIDFGAHPKPSFHYGLKVFDCDTDTTHKEIERAYRAHYRNSVSRQKEKMDLLHGR